MPHFFANRQRCHGLLAGAEDGRLHFRWETLNAVVYAAGGVVFVVGSVLFFPALTAWESWGAAMFLAGSLLYLLVTGHDFLEVLTNRRLGNRRRSVWTEIEFWAAAAYLVGTALFVFGSLFFLPALNLVPSGAWCFLFGSLLFVAGALANILQIIFADTLKTMQLLNLTAVSFVVGSTLFAVASIPFLWEFQTAADRRQLEAYLAALFVVGSLLFVAGGLFNYWRAWLVVQGGSAGAGDSGTR